MYHSYNTFSSNKVLNSRFVILDIEQVSKRRVGGYVIISTLAPHLRIMVDTQWGLLGMECVCVTLLRAPSALILPMYCLFETLVRWKKKRYTLSEFGIWQTGS